MAAPSTFRGFTSQMMPSADSASAFGRDPANENAEVPTINIGGMAFEIHHIGWARTRAIDEHYCFEFALAAPAGAAYAPQLIETGFMVPFACRTQDAHIQDAISPYISMGATSALVNTTPLADGMPGARATDASREGAVMLSDNRNGRFYTAYLSGGLSAVDAAQRVVAVNFARQGMFGLSYLAERV